MTYTFDWKPTDGPFGASHGIELPFLTGSFNEWARAPMLGSDSQAAV